MNIGVLQPGDQVNGHARVVESSVALSKNGGSFWRLTLADRSGAHISAVWWDRDDPPPPPPNIVRIKALASSYRDGLSLRLHLCDIDDGADTTEFMPRLPAKRRISSAALDQVISEIENPHIRALVETCLDGDDGYAFTLHPAAMKLHGAVAGGLLAHSIRVVEIARQIARTTHAPVDEDVLVAAALLHDIGKLDELTPNPGDEPTDTGKLLGHLVPAFVRISAAAERVPGLDRDDFETILHAVAASHGKREYGAPVTPATLEAMIVSMSDDAEAKLEAAISAIEHAAPAATWTEYVKSIDCRIKIPRRHR